MVKTAKMSTPNEMIDRNHKAKGKAKFENKAIDALSLDLPMARNTPSSFSRISCCLVGALIVKCMYARFVQLFFAHMNRPKFIHTLFGVDSMLKTTKTNEKNIVTFVIG